jgi:hypothetical protein
MVEEFRSALSRRGLPMVEPKVIVRIRGLGAVGWGARRISREVGVARNTVRRYLRGGEGAAVASRHPLKVSQAFPVERIRATRRPKGTPCRIVDTRGSAGPTVRAAQFRVGRMIRRMFDSTEPTDKIA